MSLVVIFHNSRPEPATGLRRKRASKPKVRTGCETCKKRRIKCDETRPVCNRCLSHGSICAGYNRDQTSTLLKKDDTAPPKHPRDLPPLTLEGFAVASLFTDEQEYRYFRSFRDETMFELPGFSGLDSTLWNYTIPQACSSEPSLRNLLVSIAALSKASSMQEPKPPHQQYALTQYGKGLHGVREKLAKGQFHGSTRVALIAALMIFCFEIQFGDRDVAIKHVKAAIGLLKKQLDCTSNTMSHIRHKSPVPDLGYDLIAVFVRVENHILAMRGPANPASSVTPMKSKALAHSFLREPYSLPPVFKNLDEASDYLYEIYLGHILCHGVEKPAGTLDAPLLMPSTAYHNFVKDIGRWNSAYAKLYVECSSSDTDARIIPATSIKMNSLMIVLAGRQILWPDGLLQDDITDTCRKIVQLGRLLVSDPRLPKVFGFQSGVIPPLFRVVVTCRDMSVRKEAIAVLRLAGPRRESVWESITCAEAGERFLSAENIDKSPAEAEVGVVVSRKPSCASDSDT